VLQLQPQDTTGGAVAGNSEPVTSNSNNSSGSAAANQPPAAPHLVEYVVSVTTGTALGAGTDGDVFLALTGEHGSLGERQLTGSSTHINQFERGEKAAGQCTKAPSS
jgi:hypothetical protein